MHARPRSTARLGKLSPRRAATVPPFDAGAFLASHGSARDVSKYDRGESVFSQGDACDGVRYVESGGIKLSVQSKLGREAVVAIVGPGQFLGEGCLTDQAFRIGSATAITPSVVRRVPKTKMLGVLHNDTSMSGYFIAHMLSRSIRIEQDLIAQIFNSSEKRLARTLLLMARYGTERAPVHVLARVSPATLAELSGVTRERVTFFLSKFKKLGFIEQSGTLPLKINSSLLSVVLHD
jgi:CRP/FNR family transcriptional regulator, cyclic AMP receptor protein